MTELKETVKAKYGEAAQAVLDGAEKTSCCSTSCCGGTGGGDPITSDLYDETEKAALPGKAVAASLGCGNPTALAELKQGDVVLDLGSGGGIDVLLSARRVGSTGRAFGLDMTDEMLALARRNADQAGVTNVEFLKGHIEAIPLPADSIDVVISNCVVNLAADKAAVFNEIARVLRPGGRIGISDIVADDSLTPEQRAERGSYVGCIAGALSYAEFESGLRAAGLEDVTLTTTHQVTDGMHSVIAKATKPMTTASVTPISAELPLAVASSGCGCGDGGCC